jgi:hypothetical protein
LFFTVVLRLLVLTECVFSVQIGNSTRDTKYNELREERDKLLARMATMSDSTSGTELSAAEQDLKSPAMLHWIAMVRESFEGDYGGASRHAAVLQAMFGSGDEPHTLVFCDMVKKVGRNAVNDRLLLVAGVHLQLLEPDASVRLLRVSCVLCLTSH